MELVPNLRLGRRLRLDLSCENVTKIGMRRLRMLSELLNDLFFKMLRFQPLRNCKSYEYRNLRLGLRTLFSYHNLTLFSMIIGLQTRKHYNFFLLYHLRTLFLCFPVTSNNIS